MTRPLALALCLAAGTAPAAAQRLPELPRTCRSELDGRLAFGLCPDSTFDFYASGQYRLTIPRPDSVLGYPIGSWHTTYGRMEKYIAALAAAAPERVRVFDYGESIERQTMHLVVVSAERNIARLDETRSSLARLADPRITSASEAEDISAQLPATVWLNAANDGNETAAFEAALQLAYQIAAGEDARTRRMRDDVVTIINLAHNPESHERFVAWYNAFVMGDPNPAALEHQAPWGMSTNNNHYQFDLNRDALGMTQSETRAVAAELQRWRPQVFIDLHGQTTQFFFPPAADPVNPIYPEHINRWLDVFGRANAAAFDAHGWSYFTRDVFDLYYPGYWDTYPTLHGATGMTYETDGGGSRGVRWRRDDGTILTFADGIAGHFVASLTAIETAAQHRIERLRDYYRFFVAGIERGRSSGVRSVVLLPDSSGAADALATTLLRHGIEVSRTTSDATVNATDYVTGRRASRRTPAGSYVIDMAQPNGILAHTLLAPDIALPDSFALQELRRFARNLRRAPAEREGAAFYDVTAWSLPFAHGVSALWSGTAMGVAAQRVTLPASVVKAHGGWSADVGWARVGGVDGRARSAYVWEAGGTGATRLAARLMDEGFAVVVSRDPLVVDNRDYRRGAFIVRVERNAAALHERIALLAQEAGVPVHGAASAFPERGPTGVGSNAARTLARPRVAVLAGEGVGISSYGALWFELERRIGLPFTALRAEDASGALGDFDVLVLPDGNYGAALGADSATAAVRGWIERGGTLIAYGGGARWAQGAALGVTYLRPDTSALPRDSTAAIVRRVDALAPQTELPPMSPPSVRVHDPVSVPGALLRGRLDPTHWLTSGYTTSEIPLLMRALPLRASLRGANPVVFADAERLVLGGFAWPDNTTRSYAGKPYATVDNAGRGRVILFAFDPLYRGTYTAPAQLLYNALLLR
jgi:hypothetical protein